MNLVASAGSRLVLTPENRVWYRAIAPQHAGTPISSTHSKGSLSRFSPGPNAGNPFEVLYFSDSYNVVLYEVESLLGSIDNVPVSNPARGWLLLNVHVILQQVADLTDVAAQGTLGTNAQELTGDWRGYEARRKPGSIPGPIGTAPTQALGEYLFASTRIEGFRTVSAKIPTQMNLVIFPEKLLPGSHLVYTDHTGKQHVVRAP